MALEDLKHADKLLYMEGIVTRVTDGGIEFDFKGRLGAMKVPMRMIISDYPIKVGQTVGFKMSFPEIESDAVDETYHKGKDKEEI